MVAVPNHPPPLTRLRTESGIALLTGSAQTVLRDLAAQIAAGTRQRVHAVITSPPYPNGLRDYGIAPEAWGGDPGCDHDWGDPLRAPWANSLPGPNGVAKNPHGHWRTPTAGRVCAHCGAWHGVLGEEAQFDCRRAAHADRCGQCYVCHLIDILRLVRDVLRPDGVVWVNLGDTFAASRGVQPPDPKLPARAGGTRMVPDGFKPKDLIPVAERVADAAQQDGWWRRVPLIPWLKANALPGPWTDRPIVAHEWWIMLTPAGQYAYDHIAVRRPFADARAGADGQPPRDESWRADGMRLPRGVNPSAHGGRNLRTRDLWADARDDLITELRALADALEADGLITTPDGAPLALDVPVAGSGNGQHAATFPARLIRPLIESSVPALVCPTCGAPWQRDSDDTATPERVGRSAARASGAANRPGRVWLRHITTTHGWQPTCGCTGSPDPVPGTVLDPFGGIGTTALTAYDLGRHAISIEVKPAYAQHAQERLDAAIRDRIRTSDPSPVRMRPPPPARLIHAEALDGLAQLDAASIDLIITSPPYNVGIVYGPDDPDAQPWPSYYGWLAAFVAGCARVLRSGGVLAIVAPWVVRFQHDHPFAQTWPDYDPDWRGHRDGVPVRGRGRVAPLGLALPGMCLQAGLRLREPITWVKGAPGHAISRGTAAGSDNNVLLRPVSEAIVLASAGAWHQRGGSGQRGGVDLELAKDVWHIPARRDGDHPAAFPRDIPARLIQLFAPAPDAVVLDPCCGGGTTLVAAQQAGLSAIGIDRQARFLDVARHRLEGES